MANDLFGGLGGLGNLGGALGGLMGGLAKSGLVSQETPEGKLIKAQSELKDLVNQENELLLEIGRASYEAGPDAWPQNAKLKLIRENMAAARAALDEAQSEKQQAESARAAEDAQGRCPGCGHRNPPGVKFCQECGAKLGASFCVSCGAELKAGTRFCGECGSKQGD